MNEAMNAVFPVRGTLQQANWTGPPQRSKCIALLWIEAEFDLFTVVAVVRV